MGEITKGLKTLKLRPSALIYWSRTGLGIFSAVLCTVLSLRDLLGLTLALLIYIGSYLLFRYGFKIDPKQVGDGSKLWSIGIGTYFLSWITTWILLYTILIG